MEGFRPVAEVVEEIDAAPFRVLLEERWGSPEDAFADQLIFRPNRKWLAIVDRRTRIPVDAEWLSIGIPFLYDQMRDPRLTTAASIQFGPLAKRNLVDLDRGELDGFLARRRFRLRPEEAAKCTGPGYVIARHRGFVTGLGRARAEDGGLLVEGMVPRSWPARGVGGPCFR
jgi:hypothetical protein